MIKKVILFIVEGKSDKNAISAIISKIIKNSHVKFLVMKGDITSDFGIDVKNIDDKLNEKIICELDKYKYEVEDLLKIVHLSDTDGAFITKKFMRESSSVEKFIYTEETITSKNIQSIEARNKNKGANILRLHSKTNLSLVNRDRKKIRISYSLYYLSCNIEHVLHGKLLEYSDEEKQSLSEDFEDRYIDDIEGFVNLIASVLPPKESCDYNKSWLFIKQKNNSLKRYSNFYIFLEEYIKKETTN